MTRDYPHLRIAVRSDNPLVWVSGIRQALRRAGAAPREIERFSRQAFADPEPERMRRICSDWAEVEVRRG